MPFCHFSVTSIFMLQNLKIALLAKISCLKHNVTKNVFMTHYFKKLLTISKMHWNPGKGSGN